MAILHNHKFYDPFNSQLFVKNRTQSYSHIGIPFTINYALQTVSISYRASQAIAAILYVV